LPYWLFMFHLLEKRIAEAFAAKIEALYGEKGPVQIEQPTQEPPHDPETGEVIAVPRAIAIPMIADEKTGVLNADWRAWGASFIAAIRASKSLAETMHWKAENEKALARMEKEVPKMFKGLQTSANKATAELLPKAE